MRRRPRSESLGSSYFLSVFPVRGIFNAISIYGPSTPKEVQVEPQTPLSLFCPSTSEQVQVEPQTPLSLFCSPNYFQGSSTSEEVEVPLISPTATTQTPSSLSSHTPRKLKLRAQVRNLRKRKQIPKIQEGEDFSVEVFNVMCDKFLNAPLTELIKTHIKMKSKKPLGRRYSSELKQFALALYFLSPRAYRFLAKMLTLPDKRTLERLTAKLSCQHLDQAIYDALEFKTKSMLEEDKHCILCIDEMSITTNLFFDIKSDKIIGFEDLGNGERQPKPCKDFLVIMTRGLFSSWKQPIVYFFAGAQLQAIKLLSILEKCILKLKEIPLNVEGIASDMGSNFVQLSNILGVTCDNPEFELGGKKLFYFFDPCHLIKATRNNLFLALKIKRHHGHILKHFTIQINLSFIGVHLN
ncbi:uncharacterized protein LOC115889088 [Sitophilus oryzae]|uniref:Uncharacterized protein LOC115889088 n=1 Tax=Sitophilus oryzae TaxID=7048 RepID=A0A6J2YLI4_SITOR|nr:uncharacterized protein LOC115889088 [Sitophilus oryzae]